MLNLKSFTELSNKLMLKWRRGYDIKYVVETATSEERRLARYDEQSDLMNMKFVDGDTEYTVMYHMGFGYVENVSGWKDLSLEQESEIPEWIGRIALACFAEWLTEAE